MLSATLRSARPCICRIPGRRFASHGDPQFNEPSGYLFGEKVRLDESLASRNRSNLLYVKPLPPGQKRVKEDWENVWYFGMFGTMVFAAVLLYYKPDTRCVQLKDFLSSISLIYFLAYRPGLFKKLRTGWKHEGRNTNMSRRRRLRDCPSTMPYDFVPLDVYIINHWCLIFARHQSRHTALDERGGQ